MHEEEFFGKLDLDLIRDKQTFRSELVDWVVINPDQTTNRIREIDDGDFLQIFDSHGRVLLSKTIIRDYESLYNPAYKKQMYKGMSVKWLPYGIDTGYWYNMFAQNHRARLLKKKKEE